jgi:hypothetical protein
MKNFKNFKNSSNIDYIAPIKKIVYRVEHSNKKGNWFAFLLDDAIGYANYGSKIISKNIGGLKFININKILNDSEYFDIIIKKYNNLFTIINNDLWNEYELNVGLTKYFETIKNFLYENGYNGIFTNKKLSIDYEIYLF